MTFQSPASRARPHHVVAIGLAVAALTVAGCGPTIDVATLSADDAVRMQTAADGVERSYRISPGDTLQIRYPFHPEMDQETLVQPDGRITAAGIGPLVVGGLTAWQLETVLRETSSKRLRDPEVVVTLRQVGEKTVYVGGEVGRPGTLPFRKGLTPLQAIIAAGGFRDTSRPDSVILVRAVDAEGEFIARKIDLAQVVTNGTREPITLAPHDIIFVPRTPIANANLWVRQWITELFPFIRGTSLPTPPLY